MPIELSQEQDFPEVSADIWSSMTGSDKGWKSQFNEGNVFESMYKDFVTAYYADAVDVKAAGQQVLKLFDKWRPVAEEFTKHVLRGEVDDPLDATLQWDAEGAGQAIVRPLTTQSFANATYSQTPSSTGQFNIVPDDTQANGTAETATENKQAWMVFGFAEYYAGNKVPYDYTQSKVNDDIGTRRPLHLRNAMEGNGTIKVTSRERGPLLVEPGFDLDIDANIHAPNIETGLFPLGIEVIRADAAEYGGVLD